MPLNLFHYMALVLDQWPLPSHQVGESLVLSFYIQCKQLHRFGKGQPSQNSKGKNLLQIPQVVAFTWAYD